MDALHEIMAPETAGDPITGLKWTHRTTEKISAELNSAGIAVSARTVARLLDKMDFSLRVNHKKRSTVASECRNEQFEYIKEMRQKFQGKQRPTVSVDTKKKEMLGNFKSVGAAWSKEPALVNDHDFKRDSKGTAIPRGTYDPVANRGHVCVGVSHDTSAFAADALACWWQGEGRRRYPGARQLLLLADSGGSNNHRHWGWKYSLQKKLCDRFGLTVTVCHYPPGTSKWNPIEHRLFSQISYNWAGHPLDSYETVLNHIRTTKTKTGLTVTACLMEGNYPLKVKTSKDAIAALNIRRHDVLPQWNYTIRPHSSKRKI
ncbi:ISAzo13 family transposase [bacterium]|nr:MAG: ISAzo13 family transposase [bacterium]